MHVFGAEAQNYTLVEIAGEPGHAKRIAPFVADTRAAIAVRPGFRAEDFQRPGWQWQPPFPYDWGMIMWPAQPLYYTLPSMPVEPHVVLFNAV